ncbi:hypothetical protein FJZ53_03125 [Candidatus Woesearchaeota archaeon]|nr:hypothetical protein [Candidatus Woesearchaeota archaeon]
MNKKQIAYQIGRIYNQNYDSILILSTGYFTYRAIESFIRTKGILDIPLGIFFAASSIFCGIRACKLTSLKSEKHSDIKTFNKAKENYPLEYADKVIIDDKPGLEKILDRTSMQEKKEWGTFLKAHDDKNRAVIHHIVSPDDAETSGLVVKQEEHRLYVDWDIAENNGCNGGHHYHPSKNSWINAMDYTINLNDRTVAPNNWLNILTFNMPSGPEIIGFNRQYTYIPKEKSNKAELVKATPKQIIKYLKD